jgi:tetratricopeptide (TPR) repeat protein
VSPGLAKDAPATGTAGPSDASALATFGRAADELARMRAHHAKGLLRKRWGAPDAEAFRALMKPAIDAIEARFGRLADASKKIRTQPEDERLMAESSRVLYDLMERGFRDGMFRPAAALGVLTFFVGDFKDALHWVNEAGKMDPDEVHNKLNGAVLAAEFLDFELALRLADEVLRVSPDLKLAWGLKAKGIIGLKLTEESRASDLEKKGRRDEAEALRRRAKDRPQDAASALREVVRIDPADAAGWYEFGKFLYTHGKLNDAAQAYGKATELNPSLKLAWYQKGTAHQMLEQPDEAIEGYTKGLALDRRDAGQIHFRLAAMHALKGEVDQAFEWIRTGLAINKTNFYSEIYRIEFGTLWGDPRWETLLSDFFADTGFQHTKAAQAEVGFSWGLFEYGSVLFYDSLADAFAAAEAFRREGDVAKAREFYERLAALLERDRHPLKAAIVAQRLASLAAPNPQHEGT